MDSGATHLAVTPSWLPFWPLAILAGVLLSAGVALKIARPRGAWGRRLRSRFFLGVPWGTLLTVVGVVAVYLFLQDGLAHPQNPTVVPYRAWSYRYPLGMATAGFSHAGLGHLIGNLVGTLAFAPIVEYAWGHFPRERGSESFGSLRTNPFARILAFPLVVLAVGLFSAVFAVGPVIGFSGVVFAFAGFALVSFPLPTIVAVAGSSVLRLLVQGVQTPVELAQAGRRFFTPPWANVAIQGHLLGLLLGVILATALALRRDERPSPGRLWLAAVIFAAVQGLWQFYSVRGGGRFVLYRAGGIVAIFLLATLVTATATTSLDRILVGSVGLPFGDHSFDVDLRSREFAFILLGALVLAVATPAIVTNLIVVTDDPVAQGVQVEDYVVTYVEDTDHPYYSLDVPVVGNLDSVNTSGVVVVSERRNAFQTVLSRSRLALTGSATVVVGGPGWREEVRVNRTGWRVQGNDSVYKVYVERSPDERRRVFTSEETTVAPRIDGRRMVLRPTERGFEFDVAVENGTGGSVPVPGQDETVTAGGIGFNRTDEEVFAERNGTKVKIARRTD
jgi:membrane associated rhomboid family serine protease